MSFSEWQRWAGATVVCMASGPSMTHADAEYVRERQCGSLKVITVNSTWLMAPWADVHYSSDPEWWHAHHSQMLGQVKGEMWTGDPVLQLPGLRRCVYNKTMRGVSLRRGVIAWGGNSGYCAIGLAHQFGASRIVLLGFDQSDKQGAHWHGEHPESIRRAFNWPMWHQRFGEMARDFARMGVEVVNCSRDTALRCFRRAALEDTI